MLEKSNEDEFPEREYFTEYAKRLKAAYQSNFLNVTFNHYYKYYLTGEDGNEPRLPVEEFWYQLARYVWNSHMNSISGKNRD